MEAPGLEGDGQALVRPLAVLRRSGPKPLRALALGYIELFRGTMVRHAVIAYGDEDAAQRALPRFGGEEWLDYVPVRVPGALLVHGVGLGVGHAQDPRLGT